MWVGMSWPVGRGRRVWISMPFFVVPLAAAFWVASWIIGVIIWGIVLGIVLGAKGLWRLGAMPFRGRAQHSQSRL